MTRDACGEFGKTSADLWATGRIAAKGGFEFDTGIDILDFGEDGIHGGIALGEVAHRVDENMRVVIGKYTAGKSASNDGP